MQSILFALKIGSRSSSELLAKERTANMGDGQLRQNELEEIRERMREITNEIQKLKVKRKKRRNILQSKQAKI